MRLLVILFMALWLTACGTHPPAPVEERSTERRATHLENPRQGDATEVRRGDTLYAIAFRYGLDYRDLARWNEIASPYTIYPGQRLRLTAPDGRSASSSGPSVATTMPAAQPPRVSQPVDTAPAADLPAQESMPPVAQEAPGAGSDTPPATAAPEAPAPEVTSPPAAVAVTPASPQLEDPVPSPAASSPVVESVPSKGGWSWPTDGTVVRRFNAGDSARSGLDIAGSVGQNIRAAADGSVVYSGNGLLGYGELIIIKHDERMLSAYAHNRRRLVAEGDQVVRGQKIGEMGRTDNNEVLLHFEIRLNGKPVDPATYLPPR